MGRGAAIRGLAAEGNIFFLFLFPFGTPRLWRNRHVEPHPQASARLAAALAWRWVQLGPRSMPGKEKSPGREERTPTRSFRAPGSDVRAPGQLPMHLRPQGAKMCTATRPAAGKHGGSPADLQKRKRIPTSTSGSRCRNHFWPHLGRDLISLRQTTLPTRSSPRLERTSSPCLQSTNFNTVRRLVQ